MATDPVCRMAVQREGAVTGERDGKVIWFCSRGCREEFMGNLGPDGGTHGRLTGFVRAATERLGRRN